MLGLEHPRNLRRNLFIRKRRVNGLDMVHRFLPRQIQLRLAKLVGFLDHIVHSPLLQKRDSRLERNKIAQLGHIDAVTVRITDLRRGRHDDDFFRSQTIQNPQDALPQGRTPYNRIVDSHQRIRIRPNLPVCDIIDMAYQIVPLVVAGNESPHLGILDHDLLHPGPERQYLPEFFPIRLMVQSRNLLGFLLLGIGVNRIPHPGISHLGRIGNRSEHAVLQIVIYRLQNGRHQQSSQLLALLVNLGIGSPGEIDMLERTRRLLFNRFQTRRYFYLPAITRKDDMTRRQFRHLFKRHVEHRLDYRTFRSHYQDLVIAIIISRTDAVTVADHKRIPVAHHAAEHETAVPILGNLLDNRLQIQGFRHNGRDFYLAEPLCLVFIVKPLVLMIQEFGQFFQHGYRVAHLDRMLAALHQMVEKLVDIGQVEIPGYNQVTGLPIAFPNERMDIPDIVLAESTVTQMPQEKLPAERQVVLDPSHIRQTVLMPLDPVLDVGIRPLENILDRCRRIGLHHIGISSTRRHPELDVHHPRAVLAPVMLLLHQKVHATQTVKAVAILLAVIIKRFTKPQQGYAAFVFDWFRHIIKTFSDGICFVAQIARYQRPAANTSAICRHLIGKPCFLT